MTRKNEKGFMNWLKRHSLGLIRIVMIVCIFLLLFGRTTLGFASGWEVIPLFLLRSFRGGCFFQYFTSYS